MNKEEKEEKEENKENKKNKTNEISEISEISETNEISEINEINKITENSENVVLTKQRLEAFSDGVIAIIVTIMVLNIPLPKAFSFNDIMHLMASVLVFVVSFFIVGFYWHKHYCMFYYVKTVKNTLIWRNLLFLCALSLIPVFTKWIVDNFGAPAPATAYCIVFLIVNMTYQFLFAAIIDKDVKDKLNLVNKFSLLHTLFFALAIVVLIILSISFPKVSSVLLVGIPAISSLSNLWVEHDAIKRRGKAFKRAGYKYAK